MTELFPAAFDLTNDRAYMQWRAVKIKYSNNMLTPAVVHIADPYRLSNEERRQLLQSCDRYNMVVYQLDDPSIRGKSLVATLGRQLGLVNLDANLRSDEDSISSLKVVSQAGNQYIPYTNKALSWHTDGYYNKKDRQINAIVMHCVTPAFSGGVNALLDHELVYIRLRDEDPALIEALMHPRSMTIPANIEEGVEIRAEQSGPVFSLHEPGGRLHMRFSARKRNIVWRDDAKTAEAVSRINKMLSDQGFYTSVALKSGQGIICNNVLHNRSEFEDNDSQPRLLYRARYYDRVMQ